MSLHKVGPIASEKTCKFETKMNARLAKIFNLFRRLCFLKMPIGANSKKRTAQEWLLFSGSAVIGNMSANLAGEETIMFKKEELFLFVNSTVTKRAQLMLITNTSK